MVDRDKDHAKFALATQAMRARWRAEAAEGEARNAKNRIEKMRCPACGGHKCGTCAGAGWVWADGVVPHRCPASALGVWCARPWCWACRNGTRTKAEVREMVSYQRRTLTG